MKPYKARGIVLHTIKYGDSGLVVYLYTDHAGRQTYMVQGVRSSRGKGNKAAFFQPMFLVEFEGLEPHRGEMHRMKDLRLSTPLTSLPFDVRKSTIALFMAEVVYRLIREHEVNPHLFSFLESSVAALDAMGEGVANFHLWFLVKLTYFLGFYPGNAYAPKDCFDVMRGEFVAGVPGHQLAMDAENARILGTLMECRVDELGSIGLARGQRVAFLNALLAFIGYHSDLIHGVRSVDILQEVF